MKDEYKKLFFKKGIVPKNKKDHNLWIKLYKPIMVEYINFNENGLYGIIIDFILYDDVKIIN